MVISKEGCSRITLPLGFALMQPRCYRLPLSGQDARMEISSKSLPDHKTASPQEPRSASLTFAFKTSKHAAQCTRPRNNWSTFVVRAVARVPPPAASLQTSTPSKELQISRRSRNNNAFSSTRSLPIGCCAETSGCSLKLFQHFTHFKNANTRVMFSSCCLVPFFFFFTVLAFETVKVH